MNRIILISGPCGSGKSTLADLLARRLVREQGRTVYVIHGDDFHRGFVEPEDKDACFPEGTAGDPLPWEEILAFNWDCILATAGRVLNRGLDVLIDYVVEEELPLVQVLAAEKGAALCHVVLTASGEELQRRIRQRGETNLLERALFLKNELENRPENRGHLLDSTGRSPEDIARTLCLERYRVP